MKKKAKYWLGMIAALIISIAISSCTKDNEMDHSMDNGGPDADSESICNCLNELYPAEGLSEAEKEGLIYMIEEEKLAHDVYTFLYNKWDHHVFDNITKSEVLHMDVVRCLLDKYGIEDLSEGKAHGEFENGTLQKLYDDLVEKGAQSLVNAFIVGATIEDVDLYDLQKFQNESIDNADISAAFDELIKSSRNHMRAFIKNLTKLNGTYEVQYISEEEYLEIINSEKETNQIICSE